MTITFYITGVEEESGYDLPCPSCGHSLQSAIGVQFDCTACDGYGGPEQLPTPRHELNVANINGRQLLAFFGAHEEGSLDPRDVLCRLAAGAAQLAKDVGVDHATATRYATTLTRIAERAIKYDRQISFY